MLLQHVYVLLRSRALTLLINTQLFEAKFGQPWVLTYILVHAWACNQFKISEQNWKRRAGKDRKEAESNPKKIKIKVKRLQEKLKSA